MQPPARNQLDIFSKFRQKLGCNEDKIVFCLENSCLSAKDSLKKIQTFAEDIYQNKEIIFIEHVSANHFQIQKKERNSWDLTRKDVYGDGRCGIVSTMVALKELGLINDTEFNKYIDNRSGFNKLKDAFCERGTQKNRDELVEFLCRDIPDPTTKLTHQHKISTLLSNPRRENWLDSDTIKEVLASKTNRNIKIFGQNTQHVANFDNREEALLLKIKDTKFEVATVLLGLLAQKFQGLNQVNFATDPTKLFEGEDPQLKIKLGFPEGRKVEFSDIFPIAESREKVRCFYTDNSDNVSKFLTAFDSLSLAEANLMSVNANLVNLFKNVGLLIHQIDHIKKTQPDYRGIPDVTESKRRWDDLADRILQSTYPNAELKKDITAIRERWRVGENEERLVGTIEKAKKTNKTKPISFFGVQLPDFGDDEIFRDLTENFTRLKNSGSIPDKEIFLSTCQFVDSQASDLKGKDEFLKSFANFFFDNLENFHAIGDRETANLAYSNFLYINDKLKKAGTKTLEEFLDDSDPRKNHYRQQKTRTDGYFDVFLKAETVVEEKLRQFSLELSNQNDKYIEDLHKKIEKHFEKKGTFAEKIKTLRYVFKGDVLETYAEFFSKIDSPLIPDSCKPTPDHAYCGWGQQIEVITTHNPKSFELKKDGKKITNIQYEGDQDILKWFESIEDEKLRALEITNFFRSAHKNIVICYENETTPEVLDLRQRNYHKVNKKSGQVEISSEENVEKYDSLKFKLKSSQEPSKGVSRRNDSNFFEQLAGVICCGVEGHQ